MANVSGVRGDGRYSGKYDAEEFVPPADWTEDPNGHYLRIQLHGFKTEQLRIEVASTGNLILSGERMVSQSKAVYVEKTYKLPEDSHVDNITVKFDGLNLYITIPKLATQEEREVKREHIENVNSITAGNNAQEPPRNSENPGRHDDEEYDYRQHNDIEKKVDQRKKTGHVDSFSKEFIAQLEAGPRARAMDLFGIVLAVVVALSLGVVVARRFESTEK